MLSESVLVSFLYLDQKSSRTDPIEQTPTELEINKTGINYLDVEKVSEYQSPIQNAAHMAIIPEQRNFEIA